MPVTTVTYTAFERLAAAKVNGMVTQINSHTHGGTYGAPVDLTGSTGTMDISSIGNGSITYIKLDTLDGGVTQTIKMRGGYAVYAP